ncbi:unnamed protein product [Blepharisma stoltei]|uniref:Uncharacterized protein n=1 Tax=Blepharisma stoltei TaxID=1481888 RepID=A0AAU9IRL1_9CILI|nr:unnamed protein product [Blepharisma stoltei]
MSAFSEQIFEIEDKPLKCCDKCGKPGLGPIAVGKKLSIYGKWIKSKFHIPCYTPLSLSPLKISSESPQEAIEFAEKWNKQFQILNLSTIAPIKKLEAPEPKTYFKRAWIEIFKFLTPEEAAIISCVSKEFYYYSWNSEVWNKWIPDKTQNNPADGKLAYLEKKHNTCISCGLSIKSDLVRCPILKRALCKTCKSAYNSKYHMKKIDWIMRRYRVDRNFFERNNIPVVFDSFLNAKAYTFMVEQCLDKIEKNNPTLAHIMVTRKKRRRGEG